MKEKKYQNGICSHKIFLPLYHVPISQRTRKPSAKRKLAFMLCRGAAVVGGAASRSTVIFERSERSENRIFQSLRRPAFESRCKVRAKKKHPIALQRNANDLRTVCKRFAKTEIDYSVIWVVFFSSSSSANTTDLI